MYDIIAEKYYIWLFNYNKENNMGILWNNDDLFKKYYIFDGIYSPELKLDNETINWIKNIWNKYGKYTKNIYSLFTKSNIKDGFTYLYRNICPICSEKKKDFEIHHCIPASEGGSDDCVNMLKICKDCHSLITNDRDGREGNSRFSTAIFHQIYLFGIEFYKMNPLNNKRYENIDKGLYVNYPFIKEVNEHIKILNEFEQNEFDDILKMNALYYYKYYRSIAKNIILE